MHKVLLLPGAGGSPDFWRPVASLLPNEWARWLFGWPGLGDRPHDLTVNGIDDLVRLVESRTRSRSIWWLNPWVGSSRPVSRSPVRWR